MITSEVLQELKDIEDKIDAYENGYYDTHDLDDIGENLEEYREKINHYKQFLPNEKYGFWAYKIKDGTLCLDI